MKKHLFFFFTIIVFLNANHPDQYKVTRSSELWDRIESSSNIVLSKNSYSLQLAEGTTNGYFILIPDTMPHPFDRGLPSWNGRVDQDNSGFKVSMRFRLGDGWSPWLTVGYWQDYIWSSYGSISYSGGYIDYDYVVLNTFHSTWQWRVEMKRQKTEDASPTIDKLSFFVSDERTTSTLNYTAILNDKPAEIFYPTSFIYQYDVDPTIGGSICSPTSTAMAISSYGIDVDPYRFAVDNYDNKYKMFGIWPRAVQNAAEYQLDGAVTRYRTWSQAYDTLAAGGRVVMSVGKPLYSGHIIMLAGFDSQGNPLVHDPARRDGYAHKFSKYDLSHSWFDKGGVAYTFFLKDTTLLAYEDDGYSTSPHRMTLYQNFPNPFNQSTTIRFELNEASNITLTVYDLMGREIARLLNDHFPAGLHQLNWTANGLDAGIFLLRLDVNGDTQVRRLILLK